ncbi:hypothetical protein [Glutamicibacter ardleyensis]|uniref:hypothetical protein n=1 Tax=Glutamicibacter ardleyensis TaxID=225894 RepID=UPI003FD44528
MPTDKGSNAGLKLSALAHMHSGKFRANVAWLRATTIACNLIRAAGILAEGRFTRAKIRTVRENLDLVPARARIASSARKIKLRLPENWSSAEA